MIHWFSTLRARLAGKTATFSSPDGVVFPLPGSLGWAAGSVGFSELVANGLKANPHVAACLSRWQTAASSIPVAVYQRSTDNEVPDERIDDHPAAMLLTQPNEQDVIETLIKKAMLAYWLDGNVYLDGTSIDEAGEGEPKFLRFLSPLDCVPIPDRTNQGVAGFTHTPTGKVLAPRRVFYFHQWDPLLPYRGYSPLQAASQSTCQNNEARQWNTSLLRNGSAPSGAFESIPGNSMGAMVGPSQEQRERLKQEISTKFAGSLNAGKPFVIPPGLRWVQIGLNPDDMSWLDGMKLSAAEVAEVMMVPGQLIGIEGSQTFANYEQARKAFYFDAVLPFMRVFWSLFSRWLQLRFNDPTILVKMDLEKVPALQEDRDALYQRLTNAVLAGIITRDEAREALGMSPFDHDLGTVVTVPSGQQALDVLVGTDAARTGTV